MKGASRFNPAVLMSAIAASMNSELLRVEQTGAAGKQIASGGAYHASRGGFKVNNKARRMRKGRSGKGR